MSRPRRLLQDSLLVTAAETPNAVAVRWENRSYSYRQLLEEARALAHGLQLHGLRRGDRVAILLPNGWLAAIAIYGTLLAGGVMVVINPLSKAARVDYMLRDSGAAFLIGEGVLIRKLASEIERPPDLRTVVSTEVPGSGWNALDMEQFRGSSSALPSEVSIPLDLAALIYTSGSTGRPKGVMMTHQSMVFTLGSVSEYLELHSRDIILNVLPFAFSYGLYQLLMSVDRGSTLLLESSAFPVRVLEALTEHRATILPGVPTLFANLLATAARDDLVLPAVERLTNAGAALPERLIPRLRAVFPRAKIYKMYGLTECKRVCYLDPSLISVKPGSVGKAIPGTEVYLLDQHDKPVSPGEIGLLHVRGPHLMLGYWNQPELSSRMLKPGPYPGEKLLCTQDRFRMDDEGFLYFVGRSDDIINCRGEKVSPLEVENVLFGFPGLLEAAVVGVPDEQQGEAVWAYLVMDRGYSSSEAEVRKFCRASLELTQVPSRVLFLAELPKTTSGKIRKQSLRQMATEGPNERPSLPDGDLADLFDQQRG